MSTPTDYLAALQSYMDPENGTVPYTHARICAKLCNLSDAFFADYSCMEGERIDVGEFNVWVDEHRSDYTNSDWYNDPNCVMSKHHY
jgi:hypothetical protein